MKNIVVKIRHLLMPVVICVISMLVMFVSSDEPIIELLHGTFLEHWFYYKNSIVFEMAAGVFSGMVIWFLVVYIPDRNKRKILRDNLSRQYHDFKEAILTIFMFAVEGGADMRKVEILMDYRKFQDFFEEEEENGMNRWGIVINWLSNRKDYVREIVMEMELLGREAQHARDNCGIHDQYVDAFLGRLIATPHRYKEIHIGDNYDIMMKPFMRLLWSIFAQWNYVDGQHKEDPIQRMIDRM